LDATSSHTASARASGRRRAISARACDRCLVESIVPSVARRIGDAVLASSLPRRIADGDDDSPVVDRRVDVGERTSPPAWSIANARVANGRSVVMLTITKAAPGCRTPPRDVRHLPLPRDLPTIDRFRIPR
jgi:hypothetical protein